MNYSSNRFSKTEYIILHIVLIICGWGAYNYYFFRFLEFKSYIEAKLILLGLVVFYAVTGIYMEMDDSRNETSLFMNLIAGFGTYTVVAFMRDWKRLIWSVLIICVLFSLGYALLISGCRIKNRAHFKKTMPDRMLRVFNAFRYTLCNGLAFIMIIVGITNCLGESWVKEQAVRVEAEYADIRSREYAIADKIHTISLLRDGVWEQLSVDGKLRVLQIVADIEASHLGLPHGLVVSVGKLDAMTVGQYNDRTHLITIDKDYLKNEKGSVILGVLLHECRHAYQSRIAELNLTLSGKTGKLLFFREAADFRKELSDYTSGDDDFGTYYFQHIEVDSRSYSSETVEVYFRYIDLYLEQEWGS